MSEVTDEFDALILKSVKSLEDMAAIEVKRLIELLDVEYEKAIKKDDMGRAIGIALFRATIRARKKAEEEVKAQKKFTDNIINSLADTIYIIDPKSGKGIYWNETLNKISGYSYNQMSEYPPSHFYPPEEHKLIEEVVETTLKRGRGSVELNYIIADGSRIPYEYKLMLIEDTEGKSCICVVGRDLREQKKAVAERTSELMSLFENFPDIITIVDREGVIQYINRTAEPYTPEDVIGTNMFDIPGTSEEYRRAIDLVLDGKGPYSFENSWENVQTHETIWYENRVAQIDSEGINDRCMIISTEITERKRMEAQLVRARARR